MSVNFKKLEAVNRFFSGTGYSYDRVAALCTFGLDKYWKNRLVAKLPAQPACIIDQGCGTGILTFKIARRFPGCRVIGVELRDEYLDIARQKALRSGIKNVEFITGRAEDVVLQAGCDCIVSSYLAKYAELGRLIANAGQMLRPGGFFIMHDFTYPENRIFLRVWRAYFRILKGLGSRVFPEWQTVFHELPAFLQHTRWVPECIAELKNNSFTNITSETFTFGASAVVTAKRQDSLLRQTSQ